MEKQPVIKRIAVAAALAGMAWLVGCAALSNGFVAEVLYTDNVFDASQVGGKQIVLLPLLTAAGVDSTGVLAPSRLRRFLRENRRDLRLVTLQDARGDDDPRGRAQADSLFDLLCAALYSQDIILVQGSDSLRSSVPTPYFLAVSMRGGARITGYEREPRRRVTLEAELWDSRAGVVLVRVRGRGVSARPQPPDDQFVRQTILEMVKKLPQVPFFGDHDSSW